MGLIDESGQKQLKNAKILIAGCGADGGLLAERLARFGVGEIRLADPDIFAPENFNRQFGADIDSIGRNKAEVIGQYLKKINPNLKLQIEPMGINSDNLEWLVKSCDVVIDEIDYTLPGLSLLLDRFRQKCKIPLFMGVNVAWGANVFVFYQRNFVINNLKR